MNQRPIAEQSRTSDQPGVPSERREREVVAHVADTYGGLPRLFAVPYDDGAGFPAGTVAAWGIELPDGTAITCGAAGRSFGVWGSPINAAGVLGGARPLYLSGPEAPAPA